MARVPMMHGALDDLPYLPDLNPLPENYPAKRDEAAVEAPSTLSWNDFRASQKGKGHSMAELAVMYRAYKVEGE